MRFEELQKQAEGAKEATPSRRAQESKGHPLQQLQRSLGNQAMGQVVQAKLTVSEPGDQLEQEADRVADRVMNKAGSEHGDISRASDSTVQRECSKCEEDEENVKPIQRAATGEGGLSVSPALGASLNSRLGHGQPLTPDTRRQMESSMGADFEGVRVHTDNDAAQLSRSLHASAFTYGQDIFFGQNQFDPKSTAGKHLLAHELTHVVQQDGAHDSIHRFHLPHGVDPEHQVDETSKIAPTFADLLATIKAIINDCIIKDLLGDTVNMDLLVKKAGGMSASDKIDKDLGSTPTPVASMLNYRYLFTCRCGFIDMRHFLQLMYMSNFLASSFPGMDANRASTKKGREHELTHESESRFGPEDTPSNALGAFTGESLAVTPRPDDLFKAIETTLKRCDPIDWSSLSAASKDAIKHFYGDLVPDPKAPGDLIPAHQNETAVPFVMSIAECGGKERSFPFNLDMSDPDRKTIAGTAFSSGSSGLTSDSDIRDFVATQRVEIIKGLPGAEKVRLCVRLLSGWVSDSDLDAIETIFKNATSAEKVLIKAALNPGNLSDLGQRSRLRTLLS